ncbi:lipopolysaccharide biosynthesis protein [Streptococcus uberis]|uniref:lipopolysaccharide biosynthesis protein n=1 Tax=Streptococcus uberis TaxID=1349 RepID=UPI003D6AA188
MRSIISNFLWKFMERLSAQIVTFGVSILLARLLGPKDFGVITILNVFIVFANVFVVNGFSSALIQKKETDNLDFSSVFYFTFVVSLVIYSLLFFLAPNIANWYNMPILSPTLRVLGLRVILGSLNSVQEAYTIRQLIFKKIFLSTISATIISAIVGVAMAFNGFGVWSLVYQYLVYSFIYSLVLWKIVKWRPILSFSYNRLKLLLDFGWKLLLAALIGALYDNLRTLIIGKKYSSADLGYYSRGNQFPQLFMTNLNNSISSVLFPVLSKFQDDQIKLMNAGRLSTQMTATIISPIMFGLAAIGEGLIKLLLTDKWLPSYPYLVIGCMFYLLSSVYTTYLQIYKAMGKSQISLFMEAIDGFSGILLIILSINRGIYIIALMSVVSRGIALFTCFTFNNFKYRIKIISQIKDVFFPVIFGTLMYFFILVTNKLLFNNFNYILIMFLDIIIGTIVYLSLCYFSKLPALKYIMNKYNNQKREKNVKNIY